jgi:hypothetical protein
MMLFQPLLSTGAVGFWCFDLIAFETLVVVAKDNSSTIGTNPIKRHYQQKSTC